MVTLTFSMLSGSIAGSAQSTVQEKKVLDPLEGEQNIAEPTSGTVLMGRMGPRPIDQTTFDQIFAGYKGCFVELNPQDSDSYVCYQFIQANTPLSPCSTFKIPNSMIGLETGVLKDENHLMKWDGVVHTIKPWNQDQTLKSAVANSVVWYFQRVAAAVGKQRMQHYLNLIDYGNKDISSGITNFWLERSLKITAFEQAAFLNKLQQSKLPFSQRTINITKEVIFLKETPIGKLYGKTGSGTGNNEKFKSVEDCNLGWFVGYIVTKEGTFPFATNIQGNGAWGKKAREITETILEKQGLL